MFGVALCCAILASFSVGGAAAVRGECRAGACDDRPACPQSPCRCIYPSRADCGLYYQCVRGKPLQYRCSRGLLFNEDTLTCDYDFNVNCSIEKITRTSESSTGVMTTVAGVTTPEVPETATEIGNDTTSDHPSRSLGTSTEASSNDASQKFSTEIYRTAASNEDSSTETFASESSDISVGTANTTLTGTQSESYSKSTGKDDTTIPDSSVEPKETSDFPTYSSSDTSIDTTYSKSSDFITEITSRAPTTKQSEVTETTKSTSTIKKEESTETASPVYMTEESAVPDTSEPIFTDREGEEQETNSPSTTKENVVSETISTFTAKEIKDTETTISEAKKSEEPETTNPSSRTKEIEVSETTSSKSTAKVDKETETTSFRSTITTTSKTRQANGSSGVTEHSLSTEEMQPEFTTYIPSQNWTCPSRFGLFPDQSDCNKFYHCAHWKPYNKRCPSNLHFNPTLKVCDWPENAGCDILVTSTTTHYSDLTNDKASEISSSESTVVTQLTDFVNYSTSPSKTETINNINETTATDKGLNTETTFETKATAVTGQTIVTDKSETTRAERNSSFSNITDGATIDSKFTSENVTTNSELFSTQQSDSASEFTTISIPRDSSTAVSNISPKSNATTHQESTVTETIMASSKETSETATLSDDTTEKPEITSSLPEVSKESSTSTNTFSNNSDETNSETETTSHSNTKTAETSRDTKIISLPMTVQGKISTETISSSATTLEKEVTMDIETTTSSIASNETEIISTRITTKLETTPFSETESRFEEISTISKADTYSQTEIIENSSTSVSNQETTTENSANENTEGTKDEKSHSILPEIKTTKETSVNETIKFECPKRFGLYPDPQSCFKFYQCSHWIEYHKACPSNLHFNPVLQVCDWPYRAGCGSTVSTTVTEQAMTTPSRQTTTDKGGNASFCSCDSCDLPVPDDCNSYILCIDKSATLISCGGGLNFNVKTGTCDWEENVVCDTSHECPLPVGRFPYPHSCYHFMDCNNTVMTVNKCPEGTVYSKSEEKCSWTAVCDDTYTSTETTSSAKYEGTTVMEISTHISNSEETVKETSTEDTSTSYRDDTSSELSTFSTSRTMPTKRTDKTSGTSSTFPPFTTRTERNDFSSSFRTTYEETTFTKNLSTDHTTVSDENDITITLSPLTITESTQSSKSPEIATSESNITEKFTVIPNTASVPSESLPVSSNQDFISTHSTEFGSSSDSFSTDTDIPFSSMEASTMNPATELIIPTANASTSTDTSSFEIASTTMDETTANSADFRDASTKRLVTIILSSTEISKLPSSEDHSVISELTETPTNTASSITEDYQKSVSPDVSNMTLPTTETSSNSSFVCPSRFGLFPDPDSCFRFYHCSHWAALHKWCPSDLHFSPKLQVCDWPYRAGCDGSAVVPTSEAAQPQGDDVVLNESCDCECCFYPNKTDCSKYILCLDGVPHRGQCGEGLLFNHLDDNCDIADRVTCLQKPSSCPAENGIFPHPALCAAFYKCVDGHPFLQRCPEDEHFKASEGRCTDPCDADCDNTLSCNRPHPPPTCAESDDLLPAGSDCSSYYQCAEGHAYLVKCPDGSHFNAEYGVCEPPCDARCDPTIDCPLPVQHAKSKAPDFSSASCTKPNGLFPVAEDCGAYYLCTKGRAHLLRCPPGLHYSIKDETCEPPCNAQCDRNIDCTRPKSRKPKKRIIPSSHLPLRLLCKILNNGTLPNPKNCTSFYSCSEGEARLVPCPRGLHFDPEDKECKSPCLAGCDSSIKCPFEIPVPTGRCSCENCYLQDPADCSAYLFCSQGFLTKGYCPRGTLFDKSSSQCKNVSEVVCEAIGDPAVCRSPSGNFPHPGNCKKFIRCEDSVAHVTDCEEGLEFDLAIRACANPKGYCDPTGKDPLCEEATGQFAHPKNSSLFYQCENGVKYLKSCSHPLIYNALDQVCDWPHNVQDNSTEETLKRQGTEDEIIEYGSALSAFKKSSDLKNSAGLPCQVVPGVTCPCACRVTTYDNCDSFFHCRGDGKACRRRCPEGLFFNRKTLVCDLPQNVECRDFFFATLRRLQSPNVVKASLKYPFQALHLSRTSEFHL